MGGGGWKGAESLQSRVGPVLRGLSCPAQGNAESSSVLDGQTSMKTLPCTSFGMRSIMTIIQIIQCSTNSQ